jgi:4-amino-4-deoxy-L-arabinose transferase-like glycosyltransferase
MKRVLVLLFIFFYGVLLLKPSLDISFDSPRYITIAESIASGNGYRAISEVENSPVFYNNYIFPYFLAPLIRLFGPNPCLLKILMLILSLFSLLLFFNLNLKIFSRTESFLLSLSLMLTPLSVKFSDNLLTENLFMLLLILSFYSFDRYLQKNNKKELVFFSIIIYSLIFTRIAAVIILPLLFVYCYLKKDKGLFINTAILSVLTISTIYVIQSKIALDNRFYHLKYFLYKDAFTPQLGYLDIQAMAERISGNIRFYFLKIPQDIFHLSSQSTYICTLPFWGLFLLGALKMKSRIYNKRIFIFLISYLSFFIIWPWQSTRFIYPVIFIIIVYLYAGLRELTIKFPIGIKKLIYLVIISSVLYSGIRELSLEITLNRVYPGEFNEIVRLSNWIKDNLPQDSIILSHNNALIYLLSARKGTYIPYSYDPEIISSHIDKKGVTHILADRINYEMIRYIYPWINKNRENLKIIKIDGGTILFELD